MLTLLIKKTKLKSILALSIVLSAFSFEVNAQQFLDAYISQAFSNNIVLQQKNISLQKATYALKSANSLFLPTVAFQGAYQTADGGRDIPLPLGDLLNPVYTTLNQLTSSSKFLMQENQSIQFLPQNYYDAKIRTTVPIINPDITYNKKIAAQQVVLQETEILIYKRELVKNIKVAYYNYSNALQAVEIYKSALQLANEGLRVNTKLLDGGKGLPAYVLRSKSEVETINAQLTTAQQQVSNARLYFNFLLNRNPDEQIEMIGGDNSELAKVEQLLAASSTNIREEVKQVEQVLNVNKNVLKLNSLFATPKLSAYLDLGSQSEGFKFNSTSRYYLLGLQLDVPIFTGNRNTIKIKQSRLDLENAELNANLIGKQLTLSKSIAQNNLRAAYQTYLSSVKQQEAAASYHRLIVKGYNAGSNSFLETIDARNQLTSAQLLININSFKVLSAMADLERETASYLIN